MADSANLQNPRQPGQGTVPKDQMAPPTHPTVDVPMVVPTPGETTPPSKPLATTGPGGPNISIPVVGKSGK